MAYKQEEWKNRREWATYWDTRKHPHRKDALSLIEKKPSKVLEVGCASAPMLKSVYDKFKCEVSGFDISEEAIRQAKTNLPQGKFMVADMFKPFPCKGEFDLVITDAVLIYADDNRIENVLREIKKYGRSFLFVEFHAEKDQVVDGHYIYNYPELLKELGFKNIKLEKITNWKEYCWEKFGAFITATK